MRPTLTYLILLLRSQATASTICLLPNKPLKYLMDGLTPASRIQWRRSRMLNFRAGLSVPIGIGSCWALRMAISTAFALITRDFSKRRPGACAGARGPDSVGWNFRGCGGFRKRPFERRSHSRGAQRVVGWCFTGWIAARRSPRPSCCLMRKRSNTHRSCG